jgi:hypothetical protein
MTVRTALAAIAIAAAAMGVAAPAIAAPSGPCEDVPYVGVCDPLPRTGQSPSKQSMGEVVLPSGNNIQNVS